MHETLEIHEIKKRYQVALYEAAEKAAKIIQETLDKDYNKIGMNRAKVEAAVKFLAVVEKASLPSDEEKRV